MGYNVLHALVQRQFTKYSLIENKAACRIPFFFFSDFAFDIMLVLGLYSLDVFFNQTVLGILKSHSI